MHCQKVHQIQLLSRHFLLQRLFAPVLASEAHLVSLINIPAIIRFDISQVLSVTRSNKDHSRNTVPNDESFDLIQT